MTSHGFLLGKFMPPHAGHVALCRTAARLVDRLTIMVCTRDSEPIPGALRAGWMRELLPQARVLHYAEDIPQEPSQHPHFWDIWRDAIRSIHPEPIDRVFGSEPYVIELGRTLGAEAVVVDPARRAFPVSGAAVRRDPVAHWRFIPGPVRPWYQKRIVLMGPESVGKSTLAARLAARFGSPFAPEFGRVHDAFRDPGRGWHEDDFLAICARHEAHRAAIAVEVGPLLVEDTDPLQTAVWAQMLLGHRLSALEERRQADLYLVLDPQIDFVQDGTRYFGAPTERARFYDLCHETLERAGAPYETISGDWAAREAAVLAAAERLRAEPFPGRWAMPARFHPVFEGLEM
jgi:HTH-type transcriptional regulator, transcriptional repressor of NAD biosynthesis genes